MLRVLADQFDTLLIDSIQFNSTPIVIPQTPIILFNYDYQASFSQASSFLAIYLSFWSALIVVLPSCYFVFTLLNYVMLLNSLMKYWIFQCFSNYSVRSSSLSKIKNNVILFISKYNPAINLTDLISYMTLMTINIMTSKKSKNFIKFVEFEIFEFCSKWQQKTGTKT